MQQTKKVKIVRLIIILLIIAAAVYFSFNKVMNVIAHNKKEVIVPDIVKKSLNDALTELAKNKLALFKNGDEFSADMPSGVILRQTPASGMRVREGKAIKVYVSKGGESIYVPDLEGMSIRNANIALKGEELTFGEVSTRYSESAAKGDIVEQDPPAGTDADKWTIVNVVVSDGPPPDNIKLMPNFLNIGLEQAKEMAASRSIKLEIKKEKSSEPPNTVIRQAPSPDSDITETKAGTIYISEK
ncbi:MAG: PASTA domain-containing protein [Elusimicrobiota bacterium]|jgi:serine/threonine-protein kinase|nr:PASTA domain-containing protein [Elusimicrobiota bacterium]